MTPWPDPPLTPTQSEDIAKTIEAEPTAAAFLFDTSASQAAAIQRYIVLVCVVQQRKKRGVPHEAQSSQARQLLRCMQPKMRNLLPDAFRWAPI
jgi:hypothetical protein